jgi:hypothetical protein
MSTALLRQTVVDASNSVGPNVIAIFFKTVYEIVIDLMLRNIWHIFHGYEMRRRLGNKASKRVEKRPLAIVSCIFTLVIGRERLAWRATGKKPNPVWSIPPHQIISSDVCDVLRDESGAVVLVVRVLALSL